MDILIIPILFVMCWASFELGYQFRKHLYKWEREMIDEWRDMYFKLLREMIDD